MTDETRRPARVPETDHAHSDEGAPRPGARPAPRRHSVAGGRIAAAGMGIAAMLGLVANMEIADGRAKAATPTPPSAQSSQRVAKGLRQGTAAPGKVAAAKQSRPIVLTPHAVVHTVSAPSSSGGSGGGYAYSAAAPAAAPVASSGGS